MKKKRNVKQIKIQQRIKSLYKKTNKIFNKKEIIKKSQIKNMIRIETKKMQILNHKNN